MALRAQQCQVGGVVLASIGEPGIYMLVLDDARSANYAAKPARLADCSLNRLRDVTRQSVAIAHVRSNVLLCGGPYLLRPLAHRLSPVPSSKQLGASRKG